MDADDGAPPRLCSTADTWPRASRTYRVHVPFGYDTHVRAPSDGSYPNSAAPRSSSGEPEPDDRNARNSPPGPWTYDTFNPVLVR